MSTTPSAGAARQSAWQPLEPRQRRVLGVLVEKANTTPAGYPMTVNAIVAGCNQKNNREPVTAYDDLDIEQSLSTLCDLKVASEIDWLGRVPKYKHHAYEWLGVDRTELAVLAELLLRGAQQLGDLRARAARMAPIEDLAALKLVVDGLVARGLMVELTAAGRGQVVSHNLYLRPELAELERLHSGRDAAADPRTRERASAQRVDVVPQAPADLPPVPGDDASARLEAEIASLRDELAMLRARVDELERRRGRSGS